VGSNSEIQGYNVYSMLHFHREFSSGIIVYQIQESTYCIYIYVL